VLATIATMFLLATRAMSVELFRYRGAAKDGGTLEFLADLLFRHDQRTDETNVFCRSIAGWDGCCAQSCGTTLV
jgi:hypothetical protein